MIDTGYTAIPAVGTPTYTDQEKAEIRDWCRSRGIPVEKIIGMEDGKMESIDRTTEAENG